MIIQHMLQKITKQPFKEVELKILYAMRKAKEEILANTKEIQRIFFNFDSYPFNELSLWVYIILPQNSKKAWKYENTNSIQKQAEHYLKENGLDIPIYVRFRGDREKLPSGWEISN